MMRQIIFTTIVFIIFNKPCKQHFLQSGFIINKYVSFFIETLKIKTLKIYNKLSVEHIIINKNLTGNVQYVQQDRHHS